MNRLAGTLVSRQSGGAIARITVMIGPATMTAILLEDSSSIPSNGAPVTVCFKESETALALGAFEGTMSIRNRLPCTVTSIEDDGILGRVNLDFSGTPLAALVSSESVRDLGLSAGAQVFALVKSTEVMIAAETA
jgi:molybdate transport system regulatory protein